MSPDAQFPTAEPEGVRVVDPLTQPGWDEAVNLLPGAGVFHSAAWAGVLNRSYGYSPVFLGEYSAGRLGAVLPLIEVKSWLTGRRGVSLPFADAVEPLCPNQESFSRLHAAALDLARRRAWRYLELRGGRRWLPDPAASTSFHRHLLSLGPGPDALFAAFDEATRRAVRKAERHHLEVEFSAEPAAMRHYFALHCQTRRRHGVPPQPDAFFAAIHARIISPGGGTVALVRQGGSVLAGAVFLHSGRNLLYKFSASDDRFSLMRPSNLVIWRAIQRYAALGFETLDFGRTTLDQEGLRRFKLGWGAREQRLDYVRYVVADAAYVKVPDDSTGWHTKIFRLLPGPLFRLAGRCLYPHLG